MLLGFDLLDSLWATKNPLDFSFLIYKESCSFDTHVLLPIHALFLIDVIELRNLKLLVHEEREGQIVLIFETLVRLLVATRDPEDRDVGLLKHFEIVTNRTSLSLASRRVVLGIEIEEDPLPFEVAELDLISGFSCCREIWCLVTHF